MIKTKKEYNAKVEYANKCSEAYYNTGDQIITDSDWDNLFWEIKEYETRRPDHLSIDSPTLNVGRKPSKLHRAVRYSSPMLSLDIAHFVMDVFNWAQKLCHDTNKELEFVTEYKIDGVAISVTYKNGELVNAHTRGDGVYGDDITEHILKVIGLKHKISFTGDLVLRGEAYISKENFDIVNRQRESAGKKTIKNQVGAVSGALALLDPIEFEKRKISVTFFGIAETENDNSYPKTQEELHVFLRKIGVPTFGLIRKCATPAEVVLNLEHETEEEIVAHGVVIKVNDFEMQNQIGAKSFYPNWAIAYMWKGPTSVTTVETITIDKNVHAETAIIVVKPVVVSGIEIKNIRLSARETKIFQIAVGDTVRVHLKSGCIPGIVDVIR